MMNRRRFLTISAVAVGSSLLGSSSAKQLETVWRGHAFGSEAHIVLKGNNGAAAMQAALDTIQRLEHFFSIYDPRSLISELNRTGQLTMPPEFARLMNEVELVHQNTNGLFDPTVQALFAAKLQAPDSKNTPRSGWQHVDLSAIEVRFRSKGMAITLNGIAQGFATDRVSEVLAAYGFGSVLVNIGEFKTGDEVAVLTVENAQGGMIGIQNLSNAAMATSSARGFTFSDGSGHIFRPDGQSVQPLWETVSVVAPSATRADGFSTALILAPDLALAKQLVADGQARSIILEDTDRKITRLE